MSDMNDNLPFEINYEQTKQRLVQVINQVAEKEHMPSSLMIIILENVLNDIKLNTYSMIMGNYDIKVPEGVNTNSADSKKPEQINVDLVPKNIKKNNNAVSKNTTKKPPSTKEPSSTK